MKKVLVLSVFSFVFVFGEDAGSVDGKLETLDEFLQLADPEKNISGAYYGLGVGLSKISHELKAKAVNVSEENLSSNRSQFDISLICGFGSAFYKRYYAGIEMDFFKRACGGRSYSENKRVGIFHNSTVGLNMDVRFGYLYPQHGCLVYTTFGFSRVLGRALLNRGSYYSEGSFGSFYPTIGFGAEKKINHIWNVRADYRFSITNKDDNKYLTGTTWKYEAKPERMAFRISVTRSI
ncbi:MAG: hypothetical protein LBB21_03215 [Holosporaceae bacterium]|jgi:hypothetical protein|nr:hypothetical protein [Holosporaceae bacterium]